MNWSTERDALIAQRLAFVQSVAGAMPGAAVKIVPARPASVSPGFPEPTSLAPTTVAPTTVVPAPTDNSSDNPVQSDQSGALPLERTPPRNEVRKEFQGRIAAFSGPSAPLSPGTRCVFQFGSDKGPFCNGK